MCSTSVQIDLNHLSGPHHREDCPYYSQFHPSTYWSGGNLMQVIGMVCICMETCGDEFIFKYNPDPNVC